LSFFLERRSLPPIKIDSPTRAGQLSWPINQVSATLDFTAQSHEDHHAGAQQGASI
jgi:hypothetical protein